MALSPKLLLDERLDQLLSESINAVKARERTTFQRLSGDFHKCVVLFGAGTLGRKALASMRRAGIEPLAFSDNNPQVWGSYIDGVQVLSPGDAAEQYGQRAAFLVTIWSYHHSYLKTQQQLQGLGCVCVMHGLAYYWRHPEEILPNYSLDLPSKILRDRNRVKDAFQLLGDDRSRAVFLGVLKWRLHLSTESWPETVPMGQDEPFCRLTNEVFVDCGAYDGDTVVDFIRLVGFRFAKAYALEPDPNNFARLAQTISALPADERSRIAPVCAAVGAVRGTIAFRSTGTWGACVDKKAANHQTIKVNCVSLDDLFPTNEPTLVKMDVEGAEIEAIQGAQQLIHCGKVVWAITTEHKQDDLWNIPLLIHSINPEYRFFLRPHDGEIGMDLVCYAVPNGRLANGLEPKLSGQTEV